MTQFLSLADAVRQNLKHGDIVAFEGFTHLIPVAAAHEAIRQGIKDPTLLRMTPDIVYDQMIGMGLARKVIFSYAGNPGVGLLRRMRDAIENQFPRAIETVEHSHSAMAQAYEAGAAGLPLAVFRDTLQTPTVTVSLANHDNNQHAQDENLRLGNFWDAIAVARAVMVMN